MLARNLVQKGHNVDFVVVNPKGPLLEELPKRVKLVILFYGSLMPFIRFFSKRFQIFLSRIPLALYLRKAKPDILLSGANVMHLSAITARSLSQIQVPLILRISNHLTGPLFWKKSWSKFRYRYRLYRVKRLYPKAEAIASVSKGVAEDVINVTGINPLNVRVVYSPFDIVELQEKAKAPVNHPWLKKKELPVILGVGRFSLQKDFATLIKSFSKLKEKTKARLIILGEGKERKKLEGLVERLGLKSEIDLPGFTLNPWAYMVRADLFVLSSRWEGLPGVLIEAMAVGCPVVSTDCPSGPREILADGRYGPLVPVGDITALAEAMYSVLESPPPKEKLMERAKEFDVEKVANNYLKLFRDVIVSLDT